MSPCVISYAHCPWIHRTKYLELSITPPPPPCICIFSFFQTTSAPLLLCPAGLKAVSPTQDPKLKLRARPTGCTCFPEVGAVEATLLREACRSVQPRRVRSSALTSALDRNFPVHKTPDTDMLFCGYRIYPGELLHYSYTLSEDMSRT